MTDAGKRLRRQIAYYLDPSGYIPNEWTATFDEDIVAIEAEAVAAERARIAAAVTALDLSRVRGREPFVVSRLDVLAIINGGE